MKWVKRALTRKRAFKGSRGPVSLEVEPSQKLVLGIDFSIVALVSLTALEVVHIVYIGTWNSEIFAAITGLIGTIVGLFVGAKA